jgi:hypothetical protein
VAGAGEGLAEADGVDRLEQVVDGAEVEGGEGVLAVGGGEDDVGAVLGQQGAGLEAGEAGHVDVEEDEVDLVLAAGEGGEQLLAAAALADEGDGGQLGEQAGEAAAREQLVVGEQHLQGDRRHALFGLWDRCVGSLGQVRIMRGGRRGRRRVARVPCSPGGELEGELGAAVRIGEGEALVDGGQALAAGAGAVVGAGVVEGDLDVAASWSRVTSSSIEAAVAGGGAVLDGVLGEREEDQRRDLEVAGVAGDGEGEEVGVADEVEGEEVAAEVELALRAARRRAGRRRGSCAAWRRAGGRRRSATSPSVRHHSAIALRVLKRKCGSSWPRRASSWARSASRARDSARACSRARPGLELDVAAEAPAADPEQGERDDDALAAGEEGEADAEQRGGAPGRGWRRRG